MAATERPVNPQHSLIQVKIHGRNYDAVHNKGCHTCTHPARREIEQKIVQGETYRGIADLYSGTEFTQPDGVTITLPVVGWMSIFHHFKTGHMPTELAVLRQIADKRAEELGEHYEEQTTRIVDGYSFAQQVLTRTQQRLANDELQPDIKDGLAAAKLIAEIEGAASGSVDAEAWSQAMAQYFETAKRFMPDDMWAQFCTALSTNPILLAIQRRLAAAPEDEVLEGEVVPNPEKP